MFEEDFAGRVVRPAVAADLMIASIARAKGATVVTRDVGDFEHRGLTVTDPWTASGSHGRVRRRWHEQRNAHPTRSAR